MDADEFGTDEEGSADGSGEGSGEENESIRNNHDGKKEKDFHFDIKEIEGKFFKDLKKWEQDFLEEIFKEKIPAKTSLVALHRKWSKHPSNNNKDKPTLKTPGGDSSTLNNNMLALIIMTCMSLLLAV